MGNRKSIFITLIWSISFGILFVLHRVYILGGVFVSYFSMRKDK